MSQEGVRVTAALTEEVTAPDQEDQPGWGS